MKQLIKLDDWKRKEHFQFFSKFEEPFFGVTINIDCTLAYQQAKEKDNSFFLYYLYRALEAANAIENFRYRIIDKEVYLFAQINASATINRPDETFGFSYMDYDKNEELFYQKAKEEISRVQQSKGLIPAGSGENVIHFSAVPWLDFTSLSHARSFTFPDSCPKISFGKITENNGKKLMSVSIHAHHGLMDGFHIGLFAENFQELMNEN
ncbi:chloramphenicol acetyltransferase [Chryseobacterium balustinum]|uniref:Chloramphenicol O-acetyltransferase type A n=1 Tax=Chryseobacterium balustinum TaxID=246 RepID=A0AAX2ILN3_9FLAO|nr:chloramphenicol acetyltransferase [Chryseobacterium balustinum]AZB29627.1 chloramphenicol acetyltransferase [Chryseobacterium balustinum]SKB88312.1 chloramphenicol O-acetyltransferase type A [Chryseobacterium balustinum]SQA89974.1 Chloramphenicol acetyltransferase 3 [Chryseobacterium balustinum]